MTSPTTTPRITARDLHVAYADRTVVNNVNVDFPAGHITTIIGPNGCGKSTLLRSLARLIPIQSGHVLMNGQDMSSYSRKELAQHLSMLPQSPIAPEGLLVSDLVSRGRHPHQSWIRQWSSTDQHEVHQALDMTRSLELADRRLDALSGGQRQRVWISMVLAQCTETLLLDEPTTYLDLATSIEILQLIRTLRKELNRTVVMVLHDLNLAARYSDRIVVMNSGTILEHGSPSEVIRADLLEEAFGLKAVVIDDPVTGGPLVVPKEHEQGY